MNIGILGTGSIARMMAAEFAKVPAFRCEAVCSRQQATGVRPGLLRRTEKDPAGGHRSGSRPGGCTAGLLSFQPQMTNSLAFFALVKLARTIYNKDESLNS